jgi:hypothetical protein
MFHPSGERTVVPNTVRLWQLAMSEQTTHTFDVERFNLKKLDAVEGKEQYRAEISNKFAALENLDDGVDTNIAWEAIR